MLGGEGDGQVAYEDFRTLFAPKSAVLAEMLTMAPQEAEEEAKDGTAEAEGDEPDEIPRLEAPAQQLGLLVKGAASFMQARIKKEDAGKKKASRARPKAKAPGSNRARPVLGPPRQLLQMTAPSAMGPSNPGTFRVSSQPPPVPGHMSSMPPLPPGYMVGTEKMFQHQQGLGQGAQGAMGTAGAGAMGMMGAPGAPMGANGLPGMPNAGGHAAGPAAGQQGQPAATVDPLLQSSAKNFSANAPPKHLTFLEYQEMKLEHEVQQKLQQEAESDSD
ncbi:Calmodulin [Symbiodinium pilosum]|uniref:Calmodulin protein n=1 Tax=Symbiodinium pilosum TaxID=2952 RepID=A0A812Y7A8_SYMPI|nr:Calmodulin [Symbiodinium pilosum]